ncbi:hypothetical protein VTN96DRAFT_6071 [Rasamsonia emersonii]
MDFTDVTPSEIVFKQQLSCTRFSVIFLVVIRNTTCVMKVHHGRGPKQYYENPHRETNFHILRIDCIVLWNHRETRSAALPASSQDVSK